jgi:two-component system chemotaxis sensor kinase CheA
MNIQAALDIFFEEAFEQCAALEALLLELNERPGDDEAMNAMFRAAHTIKGSAGLFAMDSVVAFAHVMESVLDGLRKRELPTTPELIDLLLQSNDRLRDILTHCQQNPDTPYAGDASHTDLVNRLEHYTAHSPVAAMAEETTSNIEPAASSGTWHIFLRYHPDFFRMGFDPSTFILYLGRIGEVTRVFTEILQPASLMSFEPTSCCMRHALALQTDADELRIREAFEFITDECEIDLLPPSSTLADFDKLAARLGDPETHLARWEELGFLPAPSMQTAIAQPEPILSHPDASPAPIEKKEAPAVDPATNPEKRRADGSRFIRIEAAKLDALINRVGELVISAASSRMRAKNTGDSDMIQAVEILSQLVEGIRDDALNLRMVPISEIFNRFPRMVHDVSQRLGKDIELDLVGAETEIDKSMVEKLTDPLMHIVRNAIDHGIEDAATRKANGKKARGLLRLKAYHDTGAVVVDVSDDGRGMDKAKILAKAQQNGLIPEGRHLSDPEILNLIFLPGFSTADQVSDLSGRGVGMDVVRRNIDALRGDIEILTEPGQGSTLRIRLPLTLAIIDGFHVEVDNCSLVLPLDMMSECMDMPTENVSTETRQINLRGDWIPYVSLRELFGFAPSREPEYVVLVQFGQTTAGIIVDRLVGDIQAVIKPLGNLFRSLRGISGSTIMGNGRLALILDIPQLIQLALKRENRLVNQRGQELTRIPPALQGIQPSRPE